MQRGYPEGLWTAGTFQEMSDFSASWALSRSRFLDTISDLSDAQLNWRLHPNCLTIAEAALHVAGVEVLFVAQLLSLNLEGDLAKLKSAATDGVVNDKPFPYTETEMTQTLVQERLAATRAMVEPLIESAERAVREKSIVSALGPVITGEGAFARLAFHAAYHQGQAYLIRTDPRFPA